MLMTDSQFSPGPIEHPRSHEDQHRLVPEPSVTAIVVNHNGGQEILSCIDHLDAQESPLHDIIVVDSGSTDDSIARLREVRPDVRIMELGENVGPAVARNRGAQATESTRLLFVDDDVYLKPNTITLLSRTLVESAAAAVTPRVVLTPDEDVIQLDGAEAHFIGTMRLRHSRKKTHEVSAGIQPIGAFSTSCVLIDRSAFLDVGGFDETFFIYLEDLELGIRLHAFGHGLLCQSDAVAVHDRGDGTPGLSFRDQGSYPKFRAYLTMRNRLQVICIHYRLRSILILLPALALYELAVLAFAVKRGWIKEWALAWIWLPRNAKSLLARRGAVQRRRRFEDGVLLSGGDLPIAPGLLGPGIEARLVMALSWLLECYWKGIRRFLGWRPSGLTPTFGAPFWRRR
jgi:hypothetical protein